MPETKPTVETKDQTAVTDPKPEGVENNDSPAPEDQIDYQKEFEESLATISKLESDNENYKKGILKAKGKLPEDEVPENPESVKIAEQLMEANQKLMAETERMIKVNKELTVALKNKAQVPATPMGNGSDPDPKKPADTLVTPEQVALLKARGWSDAKIETYKQNYAKRLANR